MHGIFRLLYIKTARMELFLAFLLNFSRLVESSEPIKTIDCDRGGDQASPNERKFLVTDDFPGKYFG